MVILTVPRAFLYIFVINKSHFMGKGKETLQWPFSQFILWTKLSPNQLHGSHYTLLLNVQIYMLNESSDNFHSIPVDVI